LLQRNAQRDYTAKNTKRKAALRSTDSAVARVQYESQHIVVQAVQSGALGTQQ